MYLATSAAETGVRSVLTKRAEVPEGRLETYLAKHDTGHIVELGTCLMITVTLERLVLLEGVVTSRWPGRATTSLICKE